MQRVYLDLRHGADDRRHKVQAHRVERRTGRDRRKRFARVGLIAAMALVIEKPRSQADPDASVDVSTENFRLRAYGRDEIDAMIKQASMVHGVDAALLTAVIQTESAFDPIAISPAGALGMMQLMPATAKSLGVDNPFDPRENILGGAKYLSGLLERFKGNMPLAVASYNAGARNVRRYRGIPPFRETQGYVRKIGRLLPETQGALFAQQLTSTRPKARVKQVSQRRAPRGRVGARSLKG